MAHTDTRVRLCRDCDGFSAVAIDTGQHHRDGSRVTLHVVCRTCDGTGTTTLRRSVVTAGR